MPASSLQELREASRKAAGWEHKNGTHCVRCRKPYSKDNVRTDAERRETDITGLCGVCWDELFPEEP